MTNRWHSPDSLAAVAQIRHGNWVQLDDLLFTLHGLGPRYAQVHSAVVDGRQLSYAYLDLPETAYDLITTHDSPVDLGTFDDLALAGEGALYQALDMAFTNGNRSKHFASKQQMALAIIKARADQVSNADQLAMHRIARWANEYERRAWWICKHRLEAYTASTINWRAMGM